VAGVFLSVGAGKFDADSYWVKLFHQIGWGDWFRYLTGILQITGAVLVVVPRTFPIDIGILACTMLGAAAVWIVKFGGRRMRSSRRRSSWRSSPSDSTARASTTSCQTKASRPSGPHSLGAVLRAWPLRGEGDERYLVSGRRWGLARQGSKVDSKLLSSVVRP
jgi:hypothetical protein